MSVPFPISLIALIVPALLDLKFLSPLSEATKTLAARKDLGRGLQGRGRGSDKRPIRVTRGTSERQKKPSVTLSFNRLLPASVLWCSFIA
jgi:hypothetical protein